MANKTPVKNASSKEVTMFDDMFEYADSGMEHTDKESFAIPFLAVMQTSSPQCEESAAEYIEGAKAGQLFNTVTNQLYDGREAGVIFLPCAFQRRFIHWGPRGTDEEGFKGEMLPEEAQKLMDDGTVVQVEGKWFFPKEDGTVDPKKCDHLSDTRNHFGVLVNDEQGTAQEVLLSLSSTQIKKSKQLMSLLSNVKVQGANGKVTPPTWINCIRITTVPESNAKGKWFGVKVQQDGFITDKDLYEQGKAFHNIIEAGEAKVNYATAAPVGETSEDDKSF